MALGSDFTDADGAPPPSPPAPVAGTAPASQPAAQPPPKAILSHEFWQRRFGAQPGRRRHHRVALGDLRLDVVGVLEPGFEMLFPPGINIERAPDVWTPMRVNFAAGSRVNVAQRVIGRLKTASASSSAQEEVDRIAADLRQQFPIKQTAGFYLRLEPLHQDLVADVRPVILALMGAVGFVMLIACANVANLLLVRAAARERELAVRSALGGSRIRLMRQLLVESLLLAVLAAIAGMILARFGDRRAHRGRAGEPAAPRSRADRSGRGRRSPCSRRWCRPSCSGSCRRCAHRSRTSWTSCARSGRTAIFPRDDGCGMPWWCSKLRSRSSCWSDPGLMMRSFVALQRAHPGYDPNGVLTFFLPNLPLPDDQARQAFVRDLRARLQALPGVIAVTAAVRFRSNRATAWCATAPRRRRRSGEVRTGDVAQRAAGLLRGDAHAR